MYSHTAVTGQLCEGSPVGLVFLGCCHRRNISRALSGGGVLQGGGGGDERESRMSWEEGKATGRPAITVAHFSW